MRLPTRGVMALRPQSLVQGEQTGMEGRSRTKPSYKLPGEPYGLLIFWQTESARRLLSQPSQAHQAERRCPQSCSLACWPHEGDSFIRAVLAAN